MGRADYFAEGDFNRICDICGFKYKASETRKQWDGLIACPECWSPRHPQDFVRGVRDRQAVPNPRPQKTVIFTRENYVDEDGNIYVDENDLIYKDSY